MKEFIVLKLGGSILTEKKGRGRIRVSFIHDFSKMFGKVWRNHFFRQGVGVILLHGAGSIGHPLVHRYALLHSSLGGKTVRGFGHVVSAMHMLTSRLSHALFQEGVPIVPLQSCVLFRPGRRGEVVFREGAFQFLHRIVRAGGVPLLGGDLGVEEKGEICVFSADRIAVALAKRLHRARLFFATNVSGVYKTFPPQSGASPLPLLTPSDIRSLIFNLRDVSVVSSHDVTGEMIGKLRSLLSLRGSPVCIFDGRSPRNIRQALLAKSIGTLLEL